ncbi:macro domain-containing protein [Chitinophaga sp. 30R24]|uniref:macro domain-containing protein n=1 Tax=Chitinophaga sp. 30R24 TaxID=3248838 RepID=UPI003B8FA184
MAVFFIKGDLFNYPGLTAYAHGCNCAGAMGKGIALDFKIRYPKMYEEYKVRCKNGTFKLGSIFVYSSPPFTVFNLGTQKNWRTKAELSAIMESLSLMLNFADDNGISQIGLPRIGAGLGGLVWDEVKEVIVHTAKDSIVNLIVFEEFLKS